MGLLTSDRSEKKGLIFQVLRVHTLKLSSFCYFAGIASFALLVSEKYSDTTYVSENALLPGLVNREFTDTAFVDEVYQTLQNESRASRGRIPYSWLTAQFRQIGLEVYRQKFTLNYPFGKQPKYKGENVYAILRAPRAPGTEAIVLSSPYRTDESIHGTNLPGIALMIGIAKFFRSKNYWAKDVIFLVNDLELVGMQAWLNAYHEIEKDQSSVLDYDILEERSGQIQGAINLEIHGDKCSRVEIKIEGLNGQLPNMDLFNVAVELATRESITPTFHGKTHPYATDFYETWAEYASTAGSMMVAQGTMLPTAAHGLFHKFAINALTLEGIPKIQKKSSGTPATFLNLGRLVEGVFRSLNNLLEKFNRSFWFYILPSTRRYVSIGYYMISFGLLIIPTLFKALNLYLNTGKDSENQQTLNATFLWSALISAFFCHLLASLLVSIPYVLQITSKWHTEQGYDTTDLLYYSPVAISVLLMLNPCLRGKSQEQKNAHKCIALLNVALLFSCLSLINISLALGLTLIYVPIVYFVGTYADKLIVNLLSRVAVILLHPTSIGFLCILGMSMWYDYEESFFTHLKRAFGGHRKTVLFYVEDWYIYGNWTYFFGAAFLFPVWLQFWYLL